MCVCTYPHILSRCFCTPLTNLVVSQVLCPLELRRILKVKPLQRSLCNPWNVWDVGLKSAKETGAREVLSHHTWAPYMAGLGMSLRVFVSWRVSTVAFLLVKG